MSASASEASRERRRVSSSSSFSSVRSSRRWPSGASSIPSGPGSMAARGAGVAEGGQQHPVGPGVDGGGGGGGFPGAAGQLPERRHPIGAGGDALADRG